MCIGEITKGNYAKYHGPYNGNIFELLSSKRGIKEIGEEEELYDKESVINGGLVCQGKKPLCEKGEYTIKKYYP